MSPKLKSHLKKSYGSCCPTQLLNETLAAERDEISDSTDRASSTDEEERWRETKRSTEELPASYWSIQKLIKSVKTGGATATIVSLCCLRDYKLNVQINQIAFMDVGGLEVLVNLLESNNIGCRMGSFRILEEISTNLDARQYLADLHIIPILVRTLCHPAVDLRISAANIIANVAKTRWTRKIFRDLRAIEILVDLLDIEVSVLRKSVKKLNEMEKEKIELVVSASNAMSSLLVSRANRRVSRRGGFVSIMCKLLNSTNTNVITSALTLCQQCAVEISFRLAISTEGMVPMIVHQLRSKKEEIILGSCLAIMEAASDSRVQILVRESGGLSLLVDVSKTEEIDSNVPLAEAVAGAIWQCALNGKNIIEFTKLGAMGCLLNILKSHETSKVLIKTVGAFAELLKYEKNRPEFLSRGGLNVLVRCLSSTSLQLLENTCNALEQCGKETSTAKTMEELNAVSKIWSLLSYTKPSIQGYAAFALCAYIESSENAGYLIRNLMGAFETLIGLLKTDNMFLLAAVCALIAQTAKYPENLAILSDHGVVGLLADRIHTTDDMLREHLAAAIASCAPHGNNIQEFGELRTVTPLVGYMASVNTRVQRTAAMALEKLSTDLQNCVTMHQAGVSPFLLEAIGVDDAVLQSAAAACLNNIRKLAMDAERATLKFMQYQIRN